MRLKLKIWRQVGPASAGRLVDYAAESVSPDMSFLEMLDVVNEGLVKKGEESIAFESMPRNFAVFNRLRISNRTWALCVRATVVSLVSTRSMFFRN